MFRKCMFLLFITISEYFQVRALIISHKNQINGRGLLKTTNNINLQKKIEIIKLFIHGYYQIPLKTQLLPYKLSNQQCHLLSKQKKIIKNIDDLLQQLHQSQFVTQKQLKSNHSIFQLNKKIAQFFLSQIKQFIFSNCSYQLNMDLIVFQTNLNVQNWIYTDNLFDEVVEKYISRYKKYSNIANCPQNFPYFNGKQCIDCDFIFNMTSNKCTKCKNQTVFNKNLKKCTLIKTTNPLISEVILNTVSKRQYIIKYTLDQSKGIEACSNQLPYFNGSKCIKCSKENPYFNLQTLICQNCAKNSYYSRIHSECLDSFGNYIKQTIK